MVKIQNSANTTNSAVINLQDPLCLPQSLLLRQKYQGGHHLGPHALYLFPFTMLNFHITSGSIIFAHTQEQQGMLDIRPNKPGHPLCKI